MAKLDSIRLRGHSGRDYDFGVYVWGHRFRPVAAAYVVMERRLDPDGTARYLPLYVGDADDLSHIFENHPREECFQVYLANTIGVHRDERSESRKGIVEDLLAALEPPCNKPENIDNLGLNE